MTTAGYRLDRIDEMVMPGEDALFGNPDERWSRQAEASVTGKEPVEFGAVAVGNCKQTGRPTMRGTLVQMSQEVCAIHLPCRVL